MLKSKQNIATLISNQINDESEHGKLLIPQNFKQKESFCFMSSIKIELS